MTTSPWFWTSTLKAPRPLDDEQYTFVFEAIETGLAEIEAELDKVKGKAGAARPPPPRKGFAAHLERVEVVIEPEDLPGCAGLEKIKIGEDTSERLDVIPVKFPGHRHPPSQIRLSRQ